jgi:hypothetical protein
MAWFAIQTERTTWTKYLVEADDEESALRDCDSWRYLGYVDGDDTASGVVGGPFEVEGQALADAVSYTDG